MLSRPAFWKSQDGYTLFEVFVVAALVMTISAIAIPVTMAMVRNARGDSALVATASFLETARNRAVSERRNMVVTFPTTNSILIQRAEWPGPALTTVGTMTLEGNQEFIREGLPDSPDLFGGPAENAINWTGAAPVMFSSEGTLIDAAGDVSNGTIFIVRRGDPTTGRAISIWGITGLLRTWKWRGSGWMQ